MVHFKSRNYVTNASVIQLSQSHMHTNDSSLTTHAVEAAGTSTQCFCPTRSGNVDECRGAVYLVSLGIWHRKWCRRGGATLLLQTFSTCQNTTKTYTKTCLRKTIQSHSLIPKTQDHSNENDSQKSLWPYLASSTMSKDTALNAVQDVAFASTQFGRLDEPSEHPKCRCEEKSTKRHVDTWSPTKWLLHFID